ncbi:hypothetical protein GCM10027418_30290 [Mariniluteicoccus endophyticus]
MRGWIAAGASLLVLLWIGALGTGLANPVPIADRAPDFPVARWLPETASNSRIALGPGGVPASLESTRTLGLGGMTTIPGPAIDLAKPPADADVSRALFWREEARGSAPGASEYRLRLVTPSGVHLVLSVGAQASALEKGLLELPTDIAAGRTWESRARLSDGRGSTEVTLKARAEKARQTAYADQGCLDVTYDVRQGETPRTDVATWCPGRGVVEGTPLLGERRAPLTGAWPDASWEPAPAARVAAAPQLVRPAMQSGLPGLGYRPADDAITIPRAGVVTVDGTLVQDNIATQSLSGMKPMKLGDGSPAWGTAWWAQPGRGTIVAYDAIGSVVVAATSDSRLIAYSSDGRRLWRRNLPDVAAGGVTPLAKDALVTVSMTGTVTAVDTTTGDKLWETDLDGYTTEPPKVAGGCVYVTIDQEGVFALDAATGKQVWDQDDVGGAVAPTPDGGAVVLHRGGQAWRLSPEGEILDTQPTTVGRAHSELVAAHGYVVATGGDSASFIDPTSLTAGEHVDDVQTIAPTADGWVAVTKTEVLSLLPNGQVRGRASLGVTAKGSRISTTVNGVMVAVWPEHGGGFALWVR